MSPSTLSLSILACICVFLKVSNAEWSKAAYILSIDQATCSDRRIGHYLDQTLTLVDKCDRSYGLQMEEDVARTKLDAVRNVAWNSRWAW